MAAKKSLGDSLVQEGAITTEQLKGALDEEKNTGERLIKVLVKKGFIAEEDLAAFVSNKLGLLRIELGNYVIDPKVIDVVPEELARKYDLVPVLKIGNRLTCAMVDPWDIFALDEVRMKTNLIIEPAVATETEVKKVINEYYGAKGSFEDIVKSVKQDNAAAEDVLDIDIEQLKGAVEEPAVIRLVNLMIAKAVNQDASDIHLEPEETELKVRFRVDGIMHEEPSLPRHIQAAIISRVKILSNLDISERRLPQDGRFNVNVEGKNIDIRTSAIPTIYGESVVLRLLDMSNACRELSSLGFAKEVLSGFEKLITSPNGIILVTGPTGCGKTTTLYASLNKISTVEKSIVTIEDPVEYRLGGIRQIQVDTKVGLTFSAGLRSVLRHDPDIVMVGEIRDFETAEIAAHAALTGHLVFSTLHTNSAAGAILRIINMGIEPYLVAYSVIGALAQRLVRKLCVHCKQAFEPQNELKEELGLRADESITLFKANGCPKCSNTGYRGRVGIYELINIDAKIGDLIITKSSINEIEQYAKSTGMISLYEDGLQKVKKGITTFEEILRVTKEQ
ncbi:MAG: ATPase, T2SS/T4P/T4SS family [Candidatus Omnitrophota bacterium]